MDKTMKAAVLVRPNTIEIHELPVPAFGPDEVLVHIDSVGICGSDLHFFTDFHIGAARIEGTRILGHEVCGTVAAVGEKADGFKCGDRVALDPTRSCGNCEFCRSGHENLCPTGAPRFLGNAYTDGALQEYFASPASRVFALPSDCPPERGCLIEPFSVALHAVKLASPQYGDTAVVMGAGCIGLMTVLALKAHGIHDITVVDLVQPRLDKALELGAAHVINAGSTDTVRAIMDMTASAGCPLVFETAGSKFTQAQTVQVLKKGGTVVMVGMSSAPDVALDINTLLRKEGTLKTVFRFTTEFGTAADMIRRHPVPLELVVSKAYPLEDAQTAFEETLEKKDEIIKSVISFS